MRNIEIQIFYFAIYCFLLDTSWIKQVRRALIICSQIASCAKHIKHGDGSNENYDEGSRLAASKSNGNPDTKSYIFRKPCFGSKRIPDAIMASRFVFQTPKVKMERQSVGNSVANCAVVRSNH